LGCRRADRITVPVPATAHELTHGVTQFAAALGYHNQTGALNEHLSDAFGIMREIANARNARACAGEMSSGLGRL